MRNLTLEYLSTLQPRLPTLPTQTTSMVRMLRPLVQSLRLLLHRAERKSPYYTHLTAAKCILYGNRKI